MKAVNKATLMGMLAVVLWSTMVGLIRAVSEAFGPTAGGALIYTTGALMLWVFTPLPRASSLPVHHLLLSSGLFVAYEVCWVLALGMAGDARQAIEVGMINYLWPTFMLTGSIVVNRQRPNLLLLPGIVLAMLGVGWVLGGERGIDLASILHNVQANPVCYLLALLAAVLWTVYSLIPPHLQGGQGSVTLFFMFTALTLWIRFLYVRDELPPFSMTSTGLLLATSGCMAAGYLAWNLGLSGGNTTAMAVASYFTPVLSAVAAAAILGSHLSAAAWWGVAMVSLGSLLCWTATRRCAPEPSRAP